MKNEGCKSWWSLLASLPPARLLLLAFILIIKLSSFILHPSSFTYVLILQPYEPGFDRITYQPGCVMNIQTLC